MYLQSPIQHSSALRDASSAFPASGSGGTFFFFFKDEPKDGPAKIQEAPTLLIRGWEA